MLKVFNILLIGIFLVSCQEDTIAKKQVRLSNGSSQNSFLSNSSEIDGNDVDGYLPTLFDLFFEKGPLEIYSSIEQSSVPFSAVNENVGHINLENKFIESEKSLMCRFRSEDSYFNIEKRHSALKDIALFKSALNNFVTINGVSNKNTIIQYYFVKDCLKDIEIFKTLVNVYGEQLKKAASRSKILVFQNGETFLSVLSRALRGEKGIIPGRLILETPEKVSLTKDELVNIEQLVSTMELFFTGLNNYIDQNSDSDYLIIDLLKEVTYQGLINELNAFSNESINNK